MILFWKALLCVIVAVILILLATTPKLFTAVTTIVGILLFVFGNVVDGIILIVAGCIFLVVNYKDDKN